MFQVRDLVMVEVGIETVAPKLDVSKLRLSRVLLPSAIAQHEDRTSTIQTWEQTVVPAERTWQILPDLLSIDA